MQTHFRLLLSGVNVSTWCYDGVKLTAVWHHAFLHFRHLRLTHGSIRRRHLHHALTSSHAQPAGGAAGIPLPPLRHHTAAGGCRKEKKKRIST